MVKCGDRFRFTPTGGNYVPAQDVLVTRIVDGGERFWCRFKREDDTNAEVLCIGLEVPGYGVLKPVETFSKQHDQITLEEWRQKARSTNWPRGG